MSFLKVVLSLIVFPLLFATTHKYYVSTTQIEYIKEQQVLQIITRINADDLERVLQERYDKSLKLTSLNEAANVTPYLLKYLDNKFSIKVNTKDLKLNYIGKEYDNDELVCYFEAKVNEEISTIEISNQVLFDLFTEQKNVIKTNILSEIHNLICTPEDQTQYLNY